MHYSPVYMIRWCGYKPNWRKAPNGNKNIYDKFLDCMNWYFENGHITNFDTNRYIQNTFQSSIVDVDTLFPKNNFGLIYDFEFDAIMNHQSSYKPLNKSIILLLLSYIRAFTWLRSDQVGGHSKKSKEIKPEIFHSQFKAMGESIGVRPRLISRATEVLCELGILKTHRMPAFKDNDDKWHKDDIIFLCPYKIIAGKGIFKVCSKDEYNWKKELEYGIKYLKELKHFSKKFYQD